MKRSLWSTVAAGAAILTLTLTGCESAESGGSGGGDGDQPYIAIVSKGFQHQFWQAVKQGAEEAAAEHDVRVTFEGPETETDVDQQIQMLTTALDKNPDAIALAALDSQAAAPLLERAQSSDIPVIAFDSGVDSDIPVTTAATDNTAAAAEAAKHMAEAIDGSGKIAIVAHDQTSSSGRDRRDGFVGYMEANEPDIEIVDTQYGGGDQLKSTDIANAMIEANPDLAGLYGTNEGSAVGVVNAVKEKDVVDSVTIVGFDSSKAQLDAIREGTEFGAVTQNPVGIGRETVEAAVKALAGEDLPETIDTGFYWYDKDTIDSEEIKPNLYE